MKAKFKTIKKISPWIILLAISSFFSFMAKGQLSSENSISKELMYLDKSYTAVNKNNFEPETDDVYDAESWMYNLQEFRNMD